MFKIHLAVEEGSRNEQIIASEYIMTYFGTEYIMTYFGAENIITELECIMYGIFIVDVRWIIIINRSA